MTADVAIAALSDVLKTSARVPITAFDPGVGVVDRWSVALDAAQARFLTDPFALVLNGSFALARATKITAPGFSIVGAIGARLRYVTTGDAGIVIAARETRLDGFALDAPAPFDAKADVGIAVNAPRCTLSGLVVSNWAGTGMRIEGDVGHGTNANEGSYTRLDFVLCGQSKSEQSEKSGGVYIQGGDTNAGLFIACNANDCRHGFYDQSFLGNTYVACSVEGCNDRFFNPQTPTGYGFMCTDPNARSLYLGCYVEEDSISDIRRPALVVGGIFSNRGSALVLNNAGAAGRFASGPSGAHGALAALGGVDGIAMSLEATGTLPHSWRFGGVPWAPDSWRLNYGGLDTRDSMRIRQGFINFPTDIQINGVRRAQRESFATMGNPQDGGQWAAGDRVAVRLPTAGEPSEYVLTTLGWRVSGRVEQ